MELTPYDALELKEDDGTFQNVTIVKFSSKPLADVDVEVVVESDTHKNKIVTSGNVTIPKENWENVGVTIGFKASSGVISGDPKIKLRMVSDDPKYQTLAKITVAANVVAEIGEFTGIPTGIQTIKESNIMCALRIEFIFIVGYILSLFYERCFRG